MTFQSFFKLPLVLLFLAVTFNLNAQSVRISINNVAINDPCSCSDPLNKVVNGEFLFHDVLTILATPNQSVEINGTSNAEFLDATGTPIPFPVAVAQTASNSGVYEIEYYHRSNKSSDITVLFTGDPGGTPFTTSNCDAATCTSIPVPTMSQWGLMIFGLLIVNLGVVSIYRKESSFY